MVTIDKSTAVYKQKNEVGGDRTAHNEYVYSVLAEGYDLNFLSLSNSSCSQAEVFQNAQH